MKTTRIAAVVAAVASAGALALTLSPAMAATSVTTVPFGPNALRFDYTLDTDATPSTTLPFREACSEIYSSPEDFSEPVLYTTTPVSVATTGTYTLSEAASSRVGTPLPAAANPAADDGWAILYRADAVTGNLVGGPTCLVGMDNIARSTTLTEGVTYTLVLADRPFGGRTVTPDNYSILLSGPGAIANAPARPTPESALAACAPGAAVPAGYNLIEGTSKFETLVGTAGKDLIRGGAGNDTVRGLGGDDILCGGEGNDTIDGGAGDDFVFGETGQDVLSGGIGDDHVDGGLGNDVLNGNDGADQLVGGDGQDTLYGQAGADELFGGAGQDVLDGGVGTDVGTDTDPRSVFRNIETVNGPPAPGPQPTATATR